VNEQTVAEYFSLLMTEGLGLDISDPDLSDTPHRVAKMLCQEFLLNCCVEFTDFFTSPNTHKYDQIICSDRIFFVSMCAHHFLPFTGNAWVLYMPEDLLIGASKMARIVEHYSRRPQLQEHLCHEVIECFHAGVKPQGCMVVMRGIHGCMKCRGVKQSGSGLTTSAIKGIFEDQRVKDEGMSLIHLSLLDKQG
jgi:GTP cyclohydrolase I